MWTEWLGDAKMDRLSLAEQGAWWRLVSLAHDCGHIIEVPTKRGKKTMSDGALILAGTPMSVTEMMKTLKITEEVDKAVFNSMLHKMEIAGSLRWNRDTLYVTHYEERQRSLTDTKEDRARRQRELRESKKIEAGDLPSPKDINIEEEVRGEREETHAQSCHVNSVTLIKELSRCYEQYIGLMNPLDADRMREFSEYYEGHAGEVDWIEKAFIKTPVNKRRWPYVQAILERYLEEGGPDDKSRQPGAEGTERPDTTKRRPLEGARETGWDVVGSGGDAPDHRDKG